MAKSHWSKMMQHVKSSNATKAPRQAGRKIDPLKQPAITGGFYHPQLKRWIKESR